MEHGTPEMYRKHLRDGTPVDDACLGAHAQAIADYRASKPPRDRTAETRAATIRRRALNRLAQENPDRLAALVAEEAARTGQATPECHYGPEGYPRHGEHDEPLHPSGQPEFECLGRASEGAGPR